MVLHLKFIEKMLQTLTHQVILDELVIGLAVVLIPDPIFNNRCRCLEVIFLLRIHLLISGMGSSWDLCPLRPCRLFDRLALEVLFILELILL